MVDMDNPPVSRIPTEEELEKAEETGKTPAEVRAEERGLEGAEELREQKEERIEDIKKRESKKKEIAETVVEKATGEERKVGREGITEQLTQAERSKLERMPEDVQGVIRAKETEELKQPTPERVGQTLATTLSDIERRERRTEKLQDIRQEFVQERIEKVKKRPEDTFFTVKGRGTFTKEGYLELLRERKKQVGEAERPPLQVEVTGRPRAKNIQLTEKQIQEPLEEIGIPSRTAETAAGITESVAQILTPVSEAGQIIATGGTNLLFGNIQDNLKLPGEVPPEVRQKTTPELIRGAVRETGQFFAGQVQRNLPDFITKPRETGAKVALKGGELSKEISPVIEEQQKLQRAFFGRTLFGFPRPRKTTLDLLPKILRKSIQRTYKIEQDIEKAALQSAVTDPLIISGGTPPVLSAIIQRPKQVGKAAGSGAVLTASYFASNPIETAGEIVEETLLPDLAVVPSAIVTGQQALTTQNVEVIRPEAVNIRQATPQPRVGMQAQDVMGQQLIVGEDVIARQPTFKANVLMPEGNLETFLGKSKARGEISEGGVEGTVKVDLLKTAEEGEVLDVTKMEQKTELLSFESQSEKIKPGVFKITGQAGGEGFKGFEFRPFTDVRQVIRGGKPRGQIEQSFSKQFTSTGRTSTAATSRILEMDQATFEELLEGFGEGTEDVQTVKPLRPDKGDIDDVFEDTQNIEDMLEDIEGRQVKKGKTPSKISTGGKTIPLRQIEQEAVRQAATQRIKTTRPDFTQTITGARKDRELLKQPRKPKTGTFPIPKLLVTARQGVTTKIRTKEDVLEPQIELQKAQQTGISQKQITQPRVKQVPRPRVDIRPRLDVRQAMRVRQRQLQKVKQAQQFDVNIPTTPITQTQVARKPDFERDIEFKLKDRDVEVEIPDIERRKKGQPLADWIGATKVEFFKRKAETPKGVKKRPVTGVLKPVAERKGLLENTGGMDIL